MDLDYIVDHITAEDVVILVDRLADEFPECSYLFRSKCDECNWVPTPEVPLNEYYITVEGLYDGQSRAKVLAVIKSVFELSYEETLNIKFPYRFVNEEFKNYEPKTIRDFIILTNAGVWCSRGSSEVFS